MRMLFKAGSAILVLLACFLVIDSIYSWWGDRPWEPGRGPEFAITLVDNYENDFLWFEYVSSGWGFGGLPISLYHPEEFKIRVTLVENEQKTFEVGLPQEISENENIQIFLNTNVLENGKVYRFEFWHVPYSGTPGPVYIDKEVECV